MVGSGEDVGIDEDVTRLLIVELLSIKLDELVPFEATGLPVLASDNEGTDDTVSDEKVEVGFTEDVDFRQDEEVGFIFDDKPEDLEELIRPKDDDCLY